MPNGSMLEAFRDRRVLITGHTGFKGAWLSYVLARIGSLVTGLSVGVPTTPSLYEALNLKQLLADDIRADVRDYRAVEAALASCDPQIVFHLAAQSLVLEGYKDPVGTFTTNVTGTLNLLEAIRLRRKPCTVIVVTSDKCYENSNRGESFRETDPLGGSDPYSASKGAAEIVTGSYLRSYFRPEKFADHAVALASARAGNVIGGGDWAEYRIAVDLARGFASKEPVRLRNPQAVRPWQHVLEPIAGYLTLAMRLEQPGGAAFAGAWNFGPLPDDAIPVSDLAVLFQREWGAETQIEHAADGDAPQEAAMLRLNVEKALNELGWRPRWNAAKMVRQTACWYRGFLVEKTSARELCDNDIRDYGLE